MKKRKKAHQFFKRQESGARDGGRLTKWATWDVNDGRAAATPSAWPARRDASAPNFGVHGLSFRGVF